MLYAHLWWCVCVWATRCWISPLLCGQQSTPTPPSSPGGQEILFVLCYAMLCCAMSCCMRRGVYNNELYVTTICWYARASHDIICNNKCVCVCVRSEDIAWLAALPCTITLEDFNAIIVHAGTLFYSTMSSIHL
jgi:hypothetical protein